MICQILFFTFYQLMTYCFIADITGKLKIIMITFSFKCFTTYWSVTMTRLCAEQFVCFLSWYSHIPLWYIWSLLLLETRSPGRWRKRYGSLWASHWPLACFRNEIRWNAAGFCRNKIFFPILGVLLSEHFYPLVFFFCFFLNSKTQSCLLWKLWFGWVYIDSTFSSI